MFPLLLLLLAQLVAAPTPFDAPPRLPRRLAAHGAGAAPPQISDRGIRREPARREHSPQQQQRRFLQGASFSTACEVGSDATGSGHSTSLPADSLEIDVSAEASDLIAQISGNTDGLTINEAISSFRGGAGSAGLYHVDELDPAGTPYCIPRSGIVMSTGKAVDYEAGHSPAGIFWGSPWNGYEPRGNDEALLQRIADARAMASDGTSAGWSGAGYHDVARLDIYFTLDEMRPDLQLTFDMVFTSEEYGGPAGTPFDGDVNGYTSFVGTPFVDAFGIFVNGVNVAEFNGQPLNIDHSDMTFFGGTQANGVCALNGDDPVLQKVFPMQGNDCQVHQTASACRQETFGAADCGAGGCDYTVCHWEASDSTCYNTLTYIIADTFDHAVDTTVFIMSLGADVDCSGLTPPAHGVWGSGADACDPSGELRDRHQCVFGCEAGYRAEGFVSCRTGSSASRARCVPEGCSGITAPAHGALVGPCTDGALSSGEQCNVVCDSGYELSAEGDSSAILSCSAGVLSGDWSGTCTDNTPPRIDCEDFVAVHADSGGCVDVDPADYIVQGHVSATDAAGSATVSVDGAAGSQCRPALDAAPYYYSLPFVAADESQNTASCDVHLFVWSMDCPSDVQIHTDAGSATATFNLPDPIFHGLHSGRHPGVSVTEEGIWSGKAPGQSVSLGLSTHQLEFTTIVDEDLQTSATCTMSVTVVDEEPPQLACPAVVVMSAPAQFDAAAYIADGRVSATDNSGTSVQINFDAASVAAQFSAADVPHQIDFTGTETVGTLTDTCTVPVHVWDIACPSISNLQASAGGMLMIPELNVTGSTASGAGTMSVQVAIEGSDDTHLERSDYFFPVDRPSTAYTLTYTAEFSGAGIDTSTKSCTTTVAVVDDIAPVVTCPGGASRVVVSGETVQVDAAGEFIDSGLVSATDTSGEVPSIEVTSAPAVQSFAPGRHTMTFVARDASSNPSASCEFELLVWDIECPAQLDLQTASGANYSITTLPHLTVSPAGVGDLQVDIAIPGRPEAHTPGDFEVLIPLVDSGLAMTYTASLAGSDLALNTKSCQTTVVVTDNEPPQVTCPSELVLKADAGGTASLSVQQGLIGRDDVTYSDNSGEVDLSWQGSESGTGTYSLGAGQTLYFGVHDEAHTLTLTATETGGQRLSSQPCVVAVSVWAIECQDIVSVTSRGGTGDATSSVPVPNPTLQGALTVADLTISATTAGIGVIAALPGDVDMGLADSGATIEYRATDSAGHEATCSALVSITDDESPVFTECPSETQYVQTGEGSSVATFTESHFAVRVTDNSGDTITPVPDVSYPITEDNGEWSLDMSHGPQTVTFRASDGTGTNVEATCVVTVEAVDSNAPVFGRCPESYVRAVPQGQTSVTVDTGDFDVTAFDHSGEPTITAEPSGVASFEATTDSQSITFTAADAEGNQAQCVTAVHVWDVLCRSSAQEANCDDGKDYATVQLFDSAAAYTLEGSKGAADIRTKVQVPGASALADPGDTVTVSLADSGQVISYMVSLIGVPDVAANTKTCNVTITVEDTQPPQITGPPELVLVADANDVGSISIQTLIDEGWVTFSDNSGAFEGAWNVPGTTQDTTDMTVEIEFPLQDEAHTLTLTATDEKGLQAEPLTVDVYVWSIDVAPIYAVTSEGGVGDIMASVTIPYPTIRGNPGQSGLSVEALLGDVPIHFEGEQDAERPMPLTDNGASIIYTASSSSAWNDGDTAPASTTVSIEDDEPPTISCDRMNVWVYTTNVSHAIAVEAERLLSGDPAVVTAEDNDAFDITYTTDVDAASITYTARQRTEHRTGETPTFLADSCTVFVEAWSIECPAALTRHTSDQIINPDVPPVYDHADISIPWGAQNVHGTAPEDVVVAVDVPGRSQQVVCSTVSDCSQVIQFPLEDSGKSLTYEVRVTDDGDATDGNIVREAFETCTTEVTVLDDEAPTFTGCPGTRSVTTDVGEDFATLSPSTFGVEAHDNSGHIETLEPSVSDGFQLALSDGNFNVMFTATDAAGNNNTCVIQVFVTDDEAPTFTLCPTDTQSYPMELGQNTRLVDAGQLLRRGVIAAEDNSGVSPTVSGPEQIELSSGTHQVPFTATDASGRTASCEVTFDVPCAPVTGPIGSTSHWRQPPPPHLTAGQSDILKVEVKDFYEQDFVENASVTFTFTSNDEQARQLQFDAVHAEGNVHELSVSIETAGSYSVRVHVAEDGGAQGLVEEISHLAVRSGAAAPGSTTVAGVEAGAPIVRTAGAETSLVFQARDQLGNLLQSGGRSLQLDISPSAGLDWSTETLQDGADGTYSSTLVPEMTTAGSFQLSVTMDGSPVTDTPFHLLILPEATVDAGETTAEGGVLDIVDRTVPWFPESCNRPTTLFFDIVPRDRFGNALGQVGPALSFTVTTDVSEESEDEDHSSHEDLVVQDRSPEGRYPVRIEDVHAHPYTLVIGLDDKLIGEGSYTIQVQRMTCPEELANTQRQHYFTANGTFLFRPPALVITYQWDANTALICGGSAFGCFVLILMLICQMWKKRLTEVVTLAGPKWMTLIGIGALLSCASVLPIIAGDLPREGNELGTIESPFVSDMACMVKDAAPSASFTMIWGSIIVKLRRTYVSVVKQDGLTDCKLGLQLLLMLGVQAAIKAAFYYHDPPRLGQELPAAEFPNNATNPNFYCYSATASYYWLMDTGWHVVLLLLAMMLAYFNRDIVQIDTGARRKGNDLSKLLNETGNVFAAAYTVVMLMVLTEFMEDQLPEDWRAQTLLRTASLLGSAVAVVFWLFLPKLYMAKTYKPVGLIDGEDGRVGEFSAVAPKGPGVGVLRARELSDSIETGTARSRVQGGAM